MNEFNFYESNKTGDTFYMAHFDELKQRFAPRDWEVFQIIVESGVSEECAAKKLIVDLTIQRHNKCISQDTAWRSIKSLTKLGVLNSKKIHTGYRFFNLLTVTELGKQLYRVTFKKEPPEQEHIALIREHASIEHGYMIKDVKKILDKSGVYRDVSIDRKKNRIALYDGRSVIPDVIAKINGMTFDYYEVECATHNQAEFNAKCNKLRSITRNINIIGRNHEIITHKLVPQIEQWVKSVGLKTLWCSVDTVTVYSMTDFAKEKRTYSLDLSEGKMICQFKPEKEDK